MFPETKSRGRSGLESENWQCFSRLLSRHFSPLFDPACCNVSRAGYNCSSVSRSWPSISKWQSLLKYVICMALLSHTVITLKIIDTNTTKQRTITGPNCPVFGFCSSCLAVYSNSINMGINNFPGNNKQSILFYLFIFVSRTKKQRIKEQLALYELNLLLFLLLRTPKFFGNLWLNIFQRRSNKTPAKREPFSSPHPFLFTANLTAMW